jgi:hypothetical protein
MKITKTQLRRIIKEEKAKLISERGTGNPALQAEERALTDAIVAFADAYMITMGMNPGDPADAKRTRRTIDDILGGVMGGILT